MQYGIGSELRDINDKSAWKTFLKKNKVYNLSKFYVAAYLAVFFFMLPMRFVFGFNAGPPTLIYRLSEWTVLGPSIGVLVILSGIPKKNSKKKRTGLVKPFFVVNVFCIAAYLSVLLGGLISGDSVDFATFVVALIGLSIITFFTALFYVILSARKFDDIYLKRYDIWSVVVAGTALFLTVLSSHQKLPPNGQVVLSGLAAVLVVLAAPVQLVKVIFELFSLKATAD